MRNAPEILQLPILRVRPYERSARNHNRRQQRKLETLLRKFGQVAPIIVDENYVIVDGRAVHQALAAVGADEIMAVVIHGRDPTELRALRLALNRIAQDTAWDNERLRAEISDLLGLGFEMQLTGFDPVEVDMILDIDEPSTGIVEDAAVADLQPAKTPSAVEPGTIWQLGRHALACGDARGPELIQRLVGHRAVAAVFTDRPYNVPIAGFVSGLGRTRHGDFAMASGEMSREAFTGFLTNVLAAVRPILGDGAILFVCIDWRHLREILGAGENNDLALLNICVWVKSNAGMGTFYRSQHEMITVWKHGIGPHQNNFELGQFGRSRSNVWAYRGVNSFGKDRAELLSVHLTVKPVQMIADALRDVTRRRELVLDHFLGSGSTLLAAEQTGRTCIGLEIDARYLEVVIRRWQKQTGKDAVLLASGETFDDRANRQANEATDDTGSASAVVSESEIRS